MSPLTRFAIIASNDDGSSCLYNTTLRWLTPCFRLAPPDCSGPRMAREGASNSLRYLQRLAPVCTPSTGQPGCWQACCWSSVWSVSLHKWSSTGSATSESRTCQFVFVSFLSTSSDMRLCWGKESQEDSSSSWLEQLHWPSCPLLDPLG